MSADNVQSAINAPPFGLLELLQTKSLGQNPNELLQGVRPTCDLQWMWAQGAPVQTLVLGGNVATLGPQTGTLLAIVPPSKTWIPISMVVYASPAGAGDQGRVKPMIGEFVGAVYVPYELGPSPTLTTSGTISISNCSWNFLETGPVRAWRNGTVFGVFCENITVAVTGLTTVVNFRYIEF